MENSAENQTQGKSPGVRDMSQKDGGQLSDDMELNTSLGKSGGENNDVDGQITQNEPLLPKSDPLQVDFCDQDKTDHPDPETAQTEPMLAQNDTSTAETNHVQPNHTEQEHDLVRKDTLKVPAFRKGKHRSLEVRISDASACSVSSEGFTSDESRRSSSRFGSYSSAASSLGGACGNCRRSRACCIFIYFWIILFCVCSFIAVIVVACKVLLPFLDAQSFTETLCKGTHRNYTKTQNQCSCGKSCKVNYPCLKIYVTYNDTNQTRQSSVFSDNEAIIGAQVSIFYRSFSVAFIMFMQIIRWISLAIH